MFFCYNILMKIINFSAFKVLARWRPAGFERSSTPALPSGYVLFEDTKQQPTASLQEGMSPLPDNCPPVTHVFDPWDTTGCEELNIIWQSWKVYTANCLDALCAGVRSTYYAILDDRAIDPQTTLPALQGWSPITSQIIGLDRSLTR